MISVFRRYSFSASHRLYRSEWDSATNSSVFGRCSGPDGHGHNYILWIGLCGLPDATIGRLIDPDAMDGVIQRNVLCFLDHRFIAQGNPILGNRIPTAENIVQGIWEVLEKQFSPLILKSVHVEETENNWASKTLAPMDPKSGVSKR